MKNITFPIAEITPGGTTLKCINLKSLSPRKPAILTTAPAYAVRHDRPLYPIAQCSLPSGATVMLLADSLNDGRDSYQLFVEDADSLSLIGSVTGRPLCAVPHGNGWILMTLAGPMKIELDTDDTWQITPGAAVTPPSIILRAVPAGTLSASVAPMTLTDCDLSRDNPELGSGAAKQLSAALIEAYRALAAQAAQTGCRFQPVIGRVELYSSSGHRLYASEPQLVALPSGWQCTQPVKVAASRNESELDVPAFNISANAFTVEAQILSLGDYEPLAATIAVSLSPQIHPVDLKALAPCRLVRVATAEPQLTIAIPGATAALGSADSARAAMLRRLIAAVDSIPCFRSSGAADAASVSVTNSPGLSADSEIAMIAAALSAPLPSASRPSLLAAVSPPDSFIARCATVSGDAVVWADITPIRSHTSLPYLPADGSAPEWSGTVRIALADGSVRLSPIGYPMPFPSALPPLLCLPDSAAVALDIWAENLETEQTFHSAVKLAPDLTGRRALYLSESLAPVTLSPAASSDFPQAPSGRLMLGSRQCGTVVAARISAPLAPLGALCVTPAPVVALHPAVKSQSSWEISRCHFYAFSPAGIFAMTLSADRSKPAATLIDPRGVTSGKLTAYTSAGVMALTSGSQLLSVATAKASTILASAPPAEAIAWNPVADTLWMLTPEATVNILNLKRLSWHNETLQLQPLDISSIGSTLTVVTTRGLINPYRPTSSSRLVSWQSRLPVSYPLKPRKLIIHMAAASFNGSVRIGIDGGAGSSQSVRWLSLSVSGSINDPIVIPLAPIRFTPYITVAIDATVSPDFTLTSLTVAT